MADLGFHEGGFVRPGALARPRKILQTTPTSDQNHALYVVERTTSLSSVNTVASEADYDWSGEAAGARLRVNFTLKLLLSQNFCNQSLMRFISFASNIGPAAAVPAGPV